MCKCESKAEARAKRREHKKGGEGSRDAEGGRVGEEGGGGVGQAVTTALIALMNEKRREK